jgi:hypothetical protein
LNEGTVTLEQLRIFVSVAERGHVTEGRGRSTSRNRLRAMRLLRAYRDVVAIGMPHHNCLKVKRTVCESGSPAGLATTRS